jgi:hypothetical protein
MAFDVSQAFQSHLANRCGQGFLLNNKQCPLSLISQHIFNSLYLHINSTSQLREGVK